MPEIGSEWHLFEPQGPAARWPWDVHRLFGTGRAALRALILQERPQRLWVPSYSCHPFYRAVEDLTELRLYRDLPTERPDVPDDPDGAVVLHDPFGIRGSLPHPRAALVIEDHTHAPDAPWAHTSTADYAVASLRKTLPLPDGAVLWSPTGRPLPDPVPEEPVGVKADGMRAKARYLAGEDVDKQAFRTVLAQGEEDLAKANGISSFSRERLARLPSLRAARQANFARLAPFAVPAVACPSFAFCVFDTAAIRDAVRAALIAERVYPSALWPMELPVGAAERALQARSFAIPVDARYTPEDFDPAVRVLASAR